jgi:hypothetical protein
MPGMYVRDSYIYNRSRSGKWNGRENAIPGKVFYVAPTTAADAGFTVASAQSWARENNQFVYNTVNIAYADCVSGRGDAIVLLPGTHTLTANIAVAKAGVSFWGPQAWQDLETQRPGATIVPLAATDGFTVTAPDVAFRGVTIVPITQKLAITGSALALRLKVVGCHIDMNVAVAHTSTKGITATGAAVDWFIKGNTFYSLGAHGPFIDVTGLLNYAIKDNDFIVLTGGTMAVGVLVGAAAQGLIQRNNFFGGTLTAAISGTGATVAASCRIFDNKFGVLCTVPIDNFSATNLTDLCNNYVATVGGGTGGTLVAANT